MKLKAMPVRRKKVAAKPRTYRTEKALQAACVKLSKAFGFTAIKLSMQGRFGTSGWPDYMFLNDGAIIFFVEFKQLGGRLTELQKQRVSELVKRGFTVYVIDRYENFSTALYKHMARSSVHGGRGKVSDQSSCGWIVS